MRAIVIAAGQGTRLRPYTNDRPKCMVEVAGRPLLHHQLKAFAEVGIDDVVVIGGYKRRGIEAPGARIVANNEYQTNNILMSLFCAGPYLVGDVVVSYGDIFYAPAILEALVESHAPGTLVVDRAWQQIYEGRTDHPIEQAELCEISPHGVVTRVGKKVGGARAFGEFIGLAKLTAPLVAKLWALYLEALDNGDDQPYGDAETLRKAYLTDILNHASARGEMLGVLAIEGGWREIDTVQDLERANAGLEWEP